jgi:hypothetical protein
MTPKPGPDEYVALDGEIKPLPPFELQQRREREQWRLERPTPKRENLREGADLLRALVGLDLNEDERLAVVAQLADSLDSSPHPSVRGLTVAHRRLIADSLIPGGDRDVGGYLPACLCREERAELSRAIDALVDPRDAFHARRYPENN